jgi:uncharacterized protein YfaS (alpha-2-macroglobulin family)
MTATTGCHPPAPVTTKAPPVPTVAIAPAPIANRGRPAVQLEPASDTARMRVALASSGAAAQLASPATPLDDATTAQLLARLAPLPDLTALNAHAPVMRPPSLPPPRSGPAQPIAFFVPAGKPVAADGSLAPPPPPRPVPIAPLATPEILPKGEVRAELAIRVRFAEPMIPVAKVGEVTVPPVRVVPSVTGTWKWIDTRVLAFEAGGVQFPRATTYTITVPAGITAVSGAKLATEAVGTFSTQPLQITRAWPRELRPDGAVAITFDQAFDAERVVKLLKLSGTKGAPIPFQVIDRATAVARLRKDPSNSFTDAQYDRAFGTTSLFLAPTSAWPADSEIHVELARGAPSAEGPLVSTDISRSDFRIVAPFTVRGFACRWDQKPRMSGNTCPAYNYGRVVFSNPIEIASYRSSMVQIEGEEFADHHTSGDEVGISTPHVAGRTFAIRIAEGLVDNHGQPLVGPRRPTFTTTREEFSPYLYASTTGLVVLDPRFDIPQWVLSGQSINNVRIQLFKVTPADYFAFETYESGTRATPPGTRVFDKSYAVGARKGIDLRVDLRPALAKEGVGHVIAIATADGNKQFSQKAWIQVTKLGLVARIDRERVSAWAQDLAPDQFLAPRPQASAQLLVEGRSPLAPTPADASGHVAFELPPPPASPAKDAPSAVLAITDGADSTFTAISRYEKTTRNETARWYVTDDRFTYKPDEEVYVKGWVRWTHDGPNPGLALPASGEDVRWELTDVRGNKVASGSAPLSADGGFDLATKLPKTVNLGTAWFKFTARGRNHTHPIKIEEFRTPTFTVALNDDVSHAGAVPLVVGESIEMQVDAAYYAGGGLGGAAVGWQAQLETTTYRPPNWNLFGFGPPVPRSQQSWGGDYYDRGERIEVSESTRLSGASSSSATMEIAALHKNRPSLLTVETVVVDVDRQRIRAESRPILVHPSSYYVGVRKRPGKPTALEVIVTDIDGEPVAGVPVEVALEGVLGSERFRDDAKVVHAQGCKLISAATPVPCEYTVQDDQTAYLALATVKDARGRINRTQYQVPWWQPADRKKDFWVTTDQQEYRPGDVAKLEIHSTVFPATAIVTFARQGMISEKRVELAGESTIVEVPVDETYLMNFYAIVDRVAKRPTSPKADPRPLPYQSTTTVDVPVDIEGARLAMKTRAVSPVIEPGESATFEIEVRHADKPMANAEVALMVVDEAVLALSNRKHTDPLPSFFARVTAGVDGANTHHLVRDAGSELAGKPGVDVYSLDALRGTGSGMGYGSGSGSLGGRHAATPSVRMGNPVALGMRERQDFRPNAVFSPRLRTDANGKARVSVKMPDSLTRFRIVAVATANTRYFGKAENTIVTQRRVNARTQAPRFLTQGDTFELPVVVQNLDPEPRTIDVAVRAANLAGKGPMGKRVTLPGGQRTEVRFDFATRERGKAMIQTIVSSGTFSDASRIELPVYVPATTESFATYGAVDSATQYEQLVVPSSIFPEVGGVEVEVSSTQMQALTDAYWYLYAYPYECAEQRSSRMLATAAIFDVLEAFATPGRPGKAEIEAQRELDIKKLAATQNPDGGFGFFRGMSSDPFVTTQVLAALVAAKHKGPTVENATRSVTNKVTDLLAALDKDVAGKPNQARRDQLPYDITLAATGLGVLAQTGVDVTPRAMKLHAQATALKIYPVEAKARLLAVLAGNERAKDVRAALRTQLVSAIQETASAATVTTSYVAAERLLLVSEARTTALTLDALIREEPEHPPILKLARGLLDKRKRGRWISTQENLVVLQAMRRYFDTYEKVTPNFVGKLWLGKAGYAEQAFVGRSNVRAQTHLDWSALGADSTHDVAIVKDGPGRLYYRVGITYAPKQLDLPALDAGFIVRRTYTPIDAPSDVTKLPDGRIRIKLGARVLVGIEVLNTTERHAVAVTDPMPAGLESVNASLAISERPVTVQADSYWDFQNLRDERSEAFRMQLGAGTHRFSYTARATTPGIFVAAPAKAEEMYSPETFGRSTGVSVVIE